MQREAFEDLESFTELFEDDIEYIEDNIYPTTWQTNFAWNYIKEMTTVDGFCPFVEPKVQSIQMECIQEPEIDLFSPFEGSCTSNEVQDLIYDWLLDLFANAYVFYREALHNNFGKNLLREFEDIEKDFQISFPQLIHEKTDFECNDFPILMHKKPIQHLLTSMIEYGVCFCYYCSEYMKTHFYQRPEININTYLPRNLTHKQLRESRTNLNRELYHHPVRIADNIKLFYRKFMLNQKECLLSITLNELKLEFDLWNNTNASENNIKIKTEISKGPYNKICLEY